MKKIVDKRYHTYDTITTCMEHIANSIFSVLT